MTLEFRNTPEGGVAATDEELVAAICRRDDAAFASLFTRYTSRLLGFLVNMLRDRELAEDVLQDVFIEVWNRAETFDPKRASVRSWLFLLTRSRATDAVRSSSARKRREEETGEREVGKPVADPRPPLEAKTALAAAAGVLSDEQRECIRLAFLGGFSISEISRQLGIPLGTAKSRYLYGLYKLRDAFVEENPK